MTSPTDNAGTVGGNDNTNSGSEVTPSNNTEPEEPVEPDEPDNG